MSVMVLFGAGALAGLIALTAVVLVTLLAERPRARKTACRDGSVL